MKFYRKYPKNLSISGQAKGSNRTMAKQTNLTSGAIVPLLLRLAGPLLVASLLQQCYNILNSMVVQHYLGTNAFSALGVADSIINLYTYVLTGACLGASVLVARFYGEENFSRLRREIYVGAVLVGGLTVVAVLAGILFLPQLLAAMHTPDELIPLTLDYLYLMLAGMFFCFTYNYLASILRAVGNTKAALYFLLLSLGYNLLAAWVLVGQFQLGIQGAAIATVTAQMLSSVLCFFYIYRYQSALRLSREDCVLDRELMGLTASFGCISALHQSSLYIGKLLIQSAVNDMGTVTIAAYTAALRVENLVLAMGNSGSEAIAIFVAQNYGAKQLSRARAGFRRGFALMVACAGTASLVMLCIFPAQMTGLFLDPVAEGESMALAVSYLRLMGIFFFLSLAGYAFVGYFRGVGRMKIPFIATTTQITVRVVGTYLLVGRMGMDAVAWSSGLGWLIINCIHGSFYYCDGRARRRSGELRD